MKLIPLCCAKTACNRAQRSRFHFVVQSGPCSTMQRNIADQSKSNKANNALKTLLLKGIWEGTIHILQVWYISTTFFCFGFWECRMVRRYWCEASQTNNWQSLSFLQDLTQYTFREENIVDLRIRFESEFETRDDTSFFVDLTMNEWADWPWLFHPQRLCCSDETDKTLERNLVTWQWDAWEVFEGGNRNKKEGRFKRGEDEDRHTVQTRGGFRSKSSPIIPCHIASYLDDFSKHSFSGKFELFFFAFIPELVFFLSFHNNVYRNLSVTIGHESGICTS